MTSAAYEELAAADQAAAILADVHDGDWGDAAHAQRVRYLWIVIGSRLKNHAAVLHVARSTGEFGQAIAFRHKLAYSAPRDIDDSIVQQACHRDLPGLRREIAEALAALGQ